MKILDLAGEALHVADYEVQRAADSRSFYFEDETVMGLLVVFERVSELLLGWQEEQDGFLKGNSAKIRMSGSKAWNLYSVFLTSGACSEGDRVRIASVEEDFRGTRKVVGTGVATRSDVNHALLPLLPLQNLLEITEADERQNLQTRLDLPGPVKTALFEGQRAEDLIKLLLEES